MVHIVNKSIIWEGDSPMEKLYQELLMENMALKQLLMLQVEKNREMYDELVNILTTLQHHPSVVDVQKLKSLTDQLVRGDHQND